ncbi:DUF721 domain-containing protein [Solitalea koreensis]|uniref:RNA-binding protein n=1 Tax=Solitalea koreensis TaxID=543615 RepID=A0A521B158_9SPHI|nr:DUF721 domain-containing protein [Solitalea koreensis]SMO40761.1 Protein of unknown function [Solitalea koreensis]
MFKKSNEQTMKEAIDLLMETYRLKEKYAEVNIVESWAQIMGPTVANLTTEIYIRNKKLYICLDSAVLRKELSMAKEKIIEVVNEKAGARTILDVIFL